MQPIYDIDIALPLASNGKYFDRARAFLKYGLVNVLPAHRVRLSVLLGDEGFLPWGFSLTMQERGVDVRVLRFGREDPAAKIYGYYLSRSLEDLGTARWWMRVDDDTSTDVGTVLTEAECLSSHLEPRHLHAYPVRPVPHSAEVHALLREVGRPALCAPDVVHDWEVSVSSQAAMLRALSQPGARHLLAGLDTPEQYGDIGLSLAMQLADIAPEPVFWLDCGPSWLAFTAWGEAGGTIAHLHLIAPDLPWWPEFTERAVSIGIPL